MINNKFAFPIGYHKFHSKQLYNFQLNRFYSSGYAQFKEMEEAGNNIFSYEDWKTEMLRLANLALSENRIMNAAIYFRAAEFYTTIEDIEKEVFYERFISLFYKAFREDNIQKYDIPYNGSFLSAIRIVPVSRKKGTILLHGGMDSFIEEFYLMMKYLANKGYEVIGFDGPGQGASLIDGRLALEIEWENPVSAILDFFDFNDVTLIGLSVGGWLCLRAAAFEPRIKRVIASGHTIHYMDIPPPPVEWIFKFFMRFENTFNRSAFKKMNMNPRMKWEIGQAMRITKSETPLEAAQKVNLALSRDNMHAEKIKQDVLFISGKEDHFIPIKLHKKQVQALANAKSVTDRIFTKEDHAQNHCQYGNIGLALDTMVKWIEEKSIF